MGVVGISERGEVSCPGGEMGQGVPERGDISPTAGRWG